MTRPRRGEERSDEPNVPPRLLVPAQQFERELDQQIASGGELVARPIESQPELEQARSDYYTWTEYNGDLLRLRFTSPSFADDYLSFSAIGIYEQSLAERIDDFRDDVREKLRRLESIKQRIPLFSAVLELGGAEPVPVDESGDAPAATTMPDERSVMVVHGRDRPARDAMFAFLRSVDLHPIEWERAVQATASGTPYTLDVVKKAFELARAVVVLFTPDDEAQLREHLRMSRDRPFESELTSQPRPNVLVEAGMALASHAARTILVEIGSIRPMSDLEGLNTVRMDNSAESRHRFVLRLQAVGLTPDTTGVDWLQEGDFDLGEPVAVATIPEQEVAPPAAQVSDAAVLRDFMETWESIDQPFTLEQFIAALGVSNEEAESILADLERQGRARRHGLSDAWYALQAR